MEINAETCATMPDMAGCEIYNLSSDHMTGMDHAAMITDINSYLHEMIPHHEEAVDSSTRFIHKTLSSIDAPLDNIQTIAQNIID